jgi:beta-galactosidase
MFGSKRPGSFVASVHAGAFFSLIISIASSVPLAIDLTRESAQPTVSPYGPGSSKSPQGEEITADQRSFFLNGKPWVPIVGEFHYARYPRAEWRDDYSR